MIAVSWSSFPTCHLPGHGDKPNMLVIWGDDIGIANLSAYTMGMMGYHTPNIDRIADEGMLLPTITVTIVYSRTIILHQSCSGLGFPRLVCTALNWA